MASAYLLYMTTQSYLCANLPYIILGQSVLILGATGATGRHVLAELLSSSHFTKVGEYGRRTTAPDQIVEGANKLEQKTIDFENLGDLSGSYILCYLGVKFCTLMTLTVVK